MTNIINIYFYLKLHYIQIKIIKALSNIYDLNIQSLYIYIYIKKPPNKKITKLNVVILNK